MPKEPPFNMAAIQLRVPPFPAGFMLRGSRPARSSDTWSEAMPATVVAAIRVAR